MQLNTGLHLKTPVRSIRGERVFKRQQHRCCSVWEMHNADILPTQIGTMTVVPWTESQNSALAVGPDVWCTRIEFIWESPNIQRCRRAGFICCFELRGSILAA
jgi:hypothetical protein